MFRFRLNEIKESLLQAYKLFVKENFAQTIYNHIMDGE